MFCLNVHHDITLAVPCQDVRAAGLGVCAAPGARPRHRPQGGAARHQPRPRRQDMDAARDSGPYWVSR